MKRIKQFLLPIAIVITFFFSLVTCYSQFPEIQWQQCYGTDDYDYTYCIEQTNNGYLVGMRVNDGTGFTNYHGGGEIWVLNIDTIGTLIWEKCFGGSIGEEPQKIVRCTGNDYFIFGYTGSTDGDVQSYHNGETDLWLVNINDQGEILWERCYGSPGPEEPRDFILTPDGGGLMLCRTHALGGDVSQYYGSWDVWLCKIDSIGNIEWEKTFGNQFLDNAGTMKITSDEHIQIIGATVADGGMVSCGHTPEFDYDIWMVKLDMNGEIIDQQCYGGSDVDFGFVMEELEDGLILAGITNSNDGDVSGYHGTPGMDGYRDIWIVRFDIDGNILWQKCLGGSEIEYPALITQTENGSFIMVGETYSNNYDVSGNHSMPGGNESDLWLVKLSSDGELLWQHCYGGYGSERLYVPHTVLKKSDYNYVLASWTDYVSDDVTCDIHQQWVRDAWILELDIDDTTNTDEYGLATHGINVYPNPAQDYVVFEFPLSTIQNPSYNIGSKNSAVITIINVFGNQVAMLPVNTEKIVWDTKDLQHGIYLYKVQSNEFQITGKLLIQY
jgi:hypothetical protein